MAHIITQSCCNDASCVSVCPVNCIHPRPDDPEFASADMLYIDPAVCIDCGACVDECPVGAIKPEDDLLESERWFVGANAGYFEGFSYDPDEMPMEPPGLPSGDFTGLRVAVVGSGPAAFYAAAEILAARGATVEMYERLDRPYGLIHSGVAPDHVRTRQVVSDFESTMRHPSFRLHLGVEIGDRLTHGELLNNHSAVVYATGAPQERSLDIPGEDLPGSDAATAFVGWYNDHPDYRDCVFDLGHKRVVIIGNGNVALDAARILASDPEDLAETEIADHAIEALRNSAVEEIVIVGRRGPRQAAYTPSELHFLTQVPGVEVVVHPNDVDVAAQAGASGESDTWSVRLKSDLFQQMVGDEKDSSTTRRIVFRYLASPTEVVGDQQAEGLRLVRNELISEGDGRTRAEASEELGVIDAGLVLRSVGYRGRAFDGLPFDDTRGVIPSREGRVVDDDGQLVERTYLTGWIKRGPRGFIGSNKACAHETVSRILEDFQEGKIPPK